MNQAVREQLKAWVVMLESLLITKRVLKFLVSSKQAKLELGIIQLVNRGLFSKQIKLEKLDRK